LSKFPRVGQPPSAVIKPDSRGRLSHIQGNASAELIDLFFRGALFPRIVPPYTTGATPSGHGGQRLATPLRRG
jgi:hypothetical protein